MSLLDAYPYTQATLDGRESWAVVDEDNLSFLRKLPDNCVHCCVTSPPYFGLRNYGVEGQIGLEATPREYVDKLVAVFREVRRVLRDDGTLWLNIGSCFAGRSASKKVAKVSSVVMDDGDEPLVLRDDLTPDELSYVLSELAQSVKRDEVARPDLPVAVDAAIAGSAYGKKV